MILRTSKIYLISVLLTLLVNFATAINYTAVSSGSWDNINIWNPVGVPTEGDNVTIPNANYTIVVPGNYTARCDSITFLGGNQNTMISLFNSTSSLIVGKESGSGNITINAATQNNRTKRVNVGEGTLWAKSLTLGHGGSNTRRALLAISTGVATITGNITSQGSGSSITFTGTGILNVGGDFMSGFPGTFSAGTGTVNFNGADQAISPFQYTFNNVVLSGTGTKNLSNATINNLLSVEGNVIITGTPNLLNHLEIVQGAVLTTSPGNYNITINGNMVNQGTFNANSANITVLGDWKNGGVFNAGMSTVIFAGTSQSGVVGNTNFYNLYCLTPSKSIIFAQGSRQIVNGLFRIDGGGFGTRINLSSDGGAGTTWDLVLNDRHDCRYVAVQGSNVSGSAFLPINPVGFRNNGDNTNWYDSDMPGEILFYDNFETSTLGSQPPDKPSSNWSIGGNGVNWFSEAAIVADTQNRTPGGSRSMYSRGGSSGQGVGAWNYPGWGPQTNCTAEAWFYDDMQTNKKQWLCVDNAAGNQAIGVKIDTTVSPTKYTYVLALWGDLQPVETFIDRTLGWHKVKWVYTSSGITELYLDDVLLVTTSGLSDFSSFDTGSWSWDNGEGSTPMWFDDFIVYRSQSQSRYRWYENDNAQTPTALANENTEITNRNIGAITRLRLQVQNNQYETWSNAYVTLQYRKGENGEWRMLGLSEDWNWTDGQGVDKAQVANALLTGTNVRQHFVESRPSQATLAMTTGQLGEWDFSIVSTPNATLATNYYFRLVITDPSGAYQRKLAAYTVYPRIVLVSPTMTQWTGAVSTAWSNPANWTNGLPDATKDAIIASGATNNCVLDTTTPQFAKSLVIQNGRTLTLSTANSSLTVSQDIAIYGNLNQTVSSATLNLNNGTLLIDTTGRYNLSAGNLTASNALIRPLNGGQFNVSGDSVITADTLNIAVGGLVNVTGAATFNLKNFTIDLNGQWISSNIHNNVNISGNYINNGSMLGSTGGVFNMNSLSGTMSGSSTTTTFYRLNINGSISNSITNDIRVLNNFEIASSSTFTASSGNIYVGSNWTNNGTFNHGSGSVLLNGTALQTIRAGGSNFYRLEVLNSSSGGVQFTDGFTTAYLINTTAGSLMRFAPGQIYNVTATGGLILNGSAGNLIRLQSSMPGAQWVINPSGASWLCNYLLVRDSINSYVMPILPTNSVDGGNTVNWFSPAPTDTDDDGLPDWWEYTHFGNLDSDGSSDNDNDGVNNFLEYNFDTDPNQNTSPVRIFVDCNSSYTGMDGSQSKPFKYLDDAINSAPVGANIFLKAGTYTLSNYIIDKDLIIVGEGTDKTFINGPYPAGSSSSYGQFLHVKSKRFSISNLTLQYFREEQPIISYSNPEPEGIIYLENLRFTANKVGSRALIAPAEHDTNARIYMINLLFYDNAAEFIAELQASTAYVYHNTITANAANGLVLQTNTNLQLANTILRENAGFTIKNAGSGLIKIYNSNIENVDTDFPDAEKCYDKPEDYIDTSIGLYKLARGSIGINSGKQTIVYSDILKTRRPFENKVDVGAYEFNPDDYDGDGLANGVEIANGTNPEHPDSDSDGLTDYEELNIFGTNPLLSDTDGDGIADGQEPAIGMNPALYDGILLVDMYNEKFEDPSRYPPNQHVSQSIWGVDATYSGDVYVETGDSYDAGDNVYINFRGQSPRSRVIMFVQRNYLPHHWIAISYKCPRARLPTNVNEALVISGAHFAVNENGYLCAYDPDRRDWRVFNGIQIPNNSWFRVMVHRDHYGRTCNVYLDVTNDGVENGILAFSNLPIYGPDLENYIRISFSSIGEFDLKVDSMLGLPFSPF